MENLPLGLIFTSVVTLLVALFVWRFTSWVLSLRTVVAPNMVHIVQTSRGNKSFGPATANGNVYYKWPGWIPVIGCTSMPLPTSNFSIELTNHPAYDKDRVQFLVDIMAFFRIDDTSLASTRISSLEDLVKQLKRSMESTVREVLGTMDIHKIMLERTTLGAAFTKSIADELKQWGVVTVKNLALNDVRDTEGQKGPIHNIMAIKTADIARESRIKVAEADRDATNAETAAEQSKQERQQEQLRVVGEKTAEQTRLVGIANEKANQEIQAEAKVTMDRAMDVRSVETQRTAEINRAADVVAADADKQVAIATADGEKQAMELKATGNLALATADAEGKRLEQMATVSPQIELAREIGKEEGYQGYLARIEQIKQNGLVGVEQAKSLGNAEIKVFANAGGGNIADGLSSASGLFNPSAGLGLGSALEAFGATEEGRKILDAIQRATGAKTEPQPPVNGSTGARQKPTAN